MTNDAQPDLFALGAAEEVLRAIYGDDLEGCTVRLEDVARIIAAATKPRDAGTRELIQVYEQVIEAIHLAATPPETGTVTDSNELRSLLSNRLDVIHALARKTIETTAAFRAQQK